MAVILTFEGFDVDALGECLITLNGTQVYSNPLDATKNDVWATFTVDVTSAIQSGLNTLKFTTPTTHGYRIRNTVVAEGSTTYLSDPTLYILETPLPGVSVTLTFNKAATGITLTFEGMDVDSVNECQARLNGTLVFNSITDATKNDVWATFTVDVTSAIQSGLNTLIFSNPEALHGSTFRNIVVRDTATGTILFSTPTGTEYTLEIPNPPTHTFTWGGPPPVQNGYITVNAYQDGTAIVAAVTLDGQSGTTPVTFTVEVGTYTLTATYQAETLPGQTVIVLQGQNVAVNCHFTMPVVKHTLFIATTAGGDTTPAPGPYEHPEGTHVTVYPTPDTGYRFLNWMLDSTVRTENPIEIIMDADHALTAYFELIPPPPPEKRFLTIVAVHGTTNPPAGTYEYALNTPVTVTELPNQGYQFVEWLLDNVSVGTDDFYTVVMDANHTLVAVFEPVVPPPDKASVTISVLGNGRTNPAAGLHTEYDIGSTIQVIGIPEIGSYCAKMRRNGIDWTEDNPGTFANLAQTELIEVVFQELITTTAFPFKGLERFPRLYEFVYGIWERWQERRG